MSEAPEYPERIWIQPCDIASMKWTGLIETDDPSRPWEQQDYVRADLAPRLSAACVTWQPMDTAPKDGTIIDLWVCRHEHVPEDCYFPKVIWFGGEWWQYEQDTTIGHADFWRPVVTPAPSREKECPRCGSYGYGCYECTPDPQPTPSPEPDDNRITLDEVEELFGGDIPILVMKILSPENSQPLTPEEARLVLRSLAIPQPDELRQAKVVTIGYHVDELRQAKAEAWMEGYEMAMLDDPNYAGDGFGASPNPYAAPDEGGE